MMSGRENSEVLKIYPYIDVYIYNYIYVCVLGRIKPFMISSATGPSYNLPYKIIYHIVDYLVGFNHLEKY